MPALQCEQTQRLTLGYSDFSGAKYSDTTTICRKCDIAIKHTEVLLVGGGKTGI